MSSGTNKPIYNKDKLCKIKGFYGRTFELRKNTWENHILKEKSRWHLKPQFDKVLETLIKPDYILRSPTEKNVASYAKKFEDFIIIGNVSVTAYLYVLVDQKSNRIRTVYDNPKLKRWKQIWPKK
jgi:hypothetical protein